MKKHRKQNEVVRRKVNSCFLGAAEPGLVRLDGPRDTDESCMIGCDNPDCVEWPNVQIVAGEHAGEWLCHLPECQMEDLSHDDAQLAIAAKDARIAELEGERDALRHSESLIQADLGMLKTDCSTPTFQLARNAVKRIKELEALLRSLEWSGGHGPEAVCPSCGEDYPLHDSECRLMAALPPQEEASE